MRLARSLLQVLALGAAMELGATGRALAETRGFAAPQRPSPAASTFRSASKPSAAAGMQGRGRSTTFRPTAFQHAGGFKDSHRALQEVPTQIGAHLVFLARNGTVTSGRVVSPPSHGKIDVEFGTNGEKFVQSIDTRHVLSYRDGGTEHGYAAIRAKLIEQRGSSDAFHSDDGPFRATPMRGNAEYKGENDIRTSKWVDASGKRPAVRYLTTAARRAPYKLSVKNGLLVDAQGNPYDTGDARSGRALFVMNSRGEIFASRFKKDGEFHHSTLSGGELVAAAGTIVVNNGRIAVLDNRTGHYATKHWQTNQMLTSLKAQGYDTSSVDVRDVESW